MFGKLISSIILISVLYILSVFFAPHFADGVADILGFPALNNTIRGIKSGVDSTSTALLQIQEGSGIINSARDAVQKTTERANMVRDTIQQKVQQGEKVVNSVQKATEAAKELQNNINDFASLSGTSATGGTASGVVSK